MSLLGDQLIPGAITATFVVKMGRNSRPRAQLFPKFLRLMFVRGRPKPRKSDASGQILRRRATKIIISVRDNCGPDSATSGHSRRVAFSLSRILLRYARACVLFRRECCSTAAIWAAAASKLRHSVSGGSRALTSAYPHINTRTACAKLSGEEL